MSTTHVHYMELVVNARIHFLRLPIEIPVLFVSVALNESFNQNGYPAEPFLAPAIQQEIALLSDSYRAEQDGIAASTADQTVWLTARTRSIAAAILFLASTTPLFDLPPAVRAANPRWYVVSVGRQIGVFQTWTVVASLVNGHPSAAYHRAATPEAGWELLRFSLMNNVIPLIP